MKIVNRLIIIAVLAILIALIGISVSAQEAQIQPKLEKILVYPGDKIELYYDNGAKKTFFGGYDYETVRSAIGEADGIKEIDGNKYYVYLKLKIIFFVDWVNKVRQIEIINPLAETIEGIVIDDSFSEAIKAYGKPDYDYNPYNIPNQQALNNNRLVVYEKLGIIFFGTINPDKITCMAIFSPKN